MRKTLVLSLCILFAMASLAAAKEVPGNRVADRNVEIVPATADLPADLKNLAAGPSLSSAAADTFHLAWFTFGTGSANPQGWTSVDLTAQLDEFFHVASGLNELTGGTFGNLLPLEGNQSVWCGVAPSAAAPYCGYSDLPGYGNGWVQYWTFCYEHIEVIVTAWLHYLIFWDSEPGYDQTFVQVMDNTSTWVNQTSVNGGVGFYDGTGFLLEWIANIQINWTWLYWRFCFISDGAWSDEDGLWPTDGAVIVDSIETGFTDINTNQMTFFHDFEAEADGAKQTLDGLWTANVPTGFGDFAALYPGVTVTQEDPCFVNFGFLWGFFDDPLITAYNCHTPNPLPTQGAMRFGPDAEGLFLTNEVWSPNIPYVGAGDQVTLFFQSYRDLPLDNLQFYVWHVRSIVAGCPSGWADRNFVYYGGQRDWLTQAQPIGDLIQAGASDIQVAVGAWDMCGFWCIIFGTGTCHSHAPLLDEVHVTRVNVAGPQFSPRHLNLFQDNFAKDGTTTGKARADAAVDIAPNASPTLQPGDSARIQVAAKPSLGTDPNTGTGPRLYAYVALWPQGQVGKAGANLEAPELRKGLKRFPHVGDIVEAGATWHCFRLDSVVTTAGAIVKDMYAIDLNDNVLTPCDTVCYVFCAIDANGNQTYLSRTLNGQGGNFTTSTRSVALSSPMEFTILPAGGWKRGGDILYVDDVDDRGGPAQLFFDTAFDILGIRDLVDRYDVLGPSSVVNNSLASRVKNIQQQITDCYRKIIWNSGDLSSGLIGDGTGNPEKSNDYGLLKTFLDTAPDNPGLYISGDDIAQEWVTLAGAGAVALRSVYMNFNLASGNHVNAGEPVSPCLVATGPCFIHAGIPDSLIAFGGCPQINDFDVLTPTGAAVTEFPYPNGSGAAVISQTTPTALTTARIVLSGFSYNYIRDKRPGFAPARVEHLRDILVWLINIVPDPTGIDPVKFANRLDNNYPNPFNPTTTIAYSIKEQGHVSLKVYNVAGQLVRTLVNEGQTPRVEGFTVTWDGRNDAGQTVSSGVYFYKMVTKNFSQTKKMVLLK